MILMSLFAYYKQVGLAYTLTYGSSNYISYLWLHFAIVDSPGDIRMGAWSKESIPKPISECIDFGVGALEPPRLPANRAMEGPSTRPMSNYHQHALIELCPDARQ